MKDLQIIHNWFTGIYSFPEKDELICITTCLTAPQDLDTNCNRTNEIDAKIQRFLDNQTYTSREQKIVNIQ